MVRYGEVDRPMMAHKPVWRLDAYTHTTYKSANNKDDKG